MAGEINIMMRSTVAGLLLVAVLVCFAGCGKTRPDFAELKTEGMGIRVFEVFGMDCPGCHGGLENLINEIQGVKISQANWKKQLLKVMVDQNAEVNDSTIHAAIKQANFTPGKRVK